MSDPIEVDVPKVPARDRHTLIFAALDGLGEGDAPLLINDHDLKPLFYQVQAERGEQIAWEPQEEGPDRWINRIVKQPIRSA